MLAFGMRAAILNPKRWDPIDRFSNRDTGLIADLIQASDAILKFARKNPAASFMVPA